MNELKRFNFLNRYDVAFVMSIILFIFGLFFLDQRPSVSIINMTFAIYVFYGSVIKLNTIRLKVKQTGDMEKVNKNQQESSINEGLNVNKSIEGLVIDLNQEVSRKAEAKTNRIMMFILGIITLVLGYIRVEMWLIILMGSIILIHGVASLYFYYIYHKKIRLNEVKIEKDSSQ